VKKIDIKYKRGSKFLKTLWQVYITMKNIMVKTKYVCHSIIRKVVECGYRPSVQIAIRYSILGIFENFKLEELHLISFIAIVELKFKKDNLCGLNQEQRP